MAKAAKNPKSESTYHPAANQFEHEGKVYEVLIPVMIIPEIGQRTALEICCDEEAQAALLNANCIGSVLKEVIQ